MIETVVETNNLTKVYERGKVEVPALRGITIKIPRGEIACIAGASGSGKSTLLNLMGGIDTPTSGEISVSGINLNKLGQTDLADFRLKNVGFVFQFYNLIPTLTALENTEIPLILAKVPKEERQTQSKKLLELVGLEQRIMHRPDELSGGEQQRVAIARALANEPSLVLADEPTGDLDTHTAEDLMDLIIELNKTKHQTFIISTHDQHVIQRGTRTYTIKDGKIEA
jgi:putative ABC transport system ATP-binding protein